MEGHCSTGQSPQWAVVLMEEEEDDVMMMIIMMIKKINLQFALLYMPSNTTGFR